MPSAGLSVLQSKRQLLAHRTQIPLPTPPPALCTPLQGLWVPWAYPCIKKMGKLRHTEGKDLPKITQGVSEEAGQGPRAPYPSQCQEVGNEGVHLGLESGTVSAKPVEST